MKYDRSRFQHWAPAATSRSQQSFRHASRCADRFTVETLIPQARSQQPICTIPSLPYTATPFRCSSMPADDLGCHDRLTRRRHLPPRSSHLLRFAELADKQCGAGFSGTADWAGLNENVPPKPSKFVRVSHWKQMGAQMSLASACGRFQSASRCFGFIP